jgi:hypothetical protein
VSVNPTPKTTSSPDPRPAGPRDHDDWTAIEIRALRLWQAPDPAAGFEDRLLARVRSESATSVSPMRAMAVAALALVLVGGLFSVRAMFGRSGHSGASFEFQPAAGFATQDAGPGPEVRAPLDGIGAEPS